MRNTLILLMLSVILCGCQSSWEYKVLEVPATPAVEGTGEFGKQQVALNGAELDDLGQQGWELVSCMLEMETAQPNYGNEDYHTGIKPNVRPSRAVLVFKRSR